MDSTKTDLAGNRDFSVAPRLTIINCQLCRRGIVIQLDFGKALALARGSTLDSRQIIAKRQKQSCLLMVPLKQPKSNLFAENSDTLKREPSKRIGNKLPRANPSGSRKGQAEKIKKQPQGALHIRKCPFGVCKDGWI